MNVPMTVLYENLKQDMADLINNSGLPAFMVEPILQNYLNETRIAMDKQYQLDKALYEQSLLETVNEE